jgi:asparagine N-glycosylation enzyme membrane subunit Stt3
VLAVVAGRDRDHPDVVAMSLGHYVGFAALGVLLGLVVVWTMLAVPALNGSVLAWYGWVAALFAAVAFEVPDRAVLPVALAVPVVLAGVLGFAVAWAGSDHIRRPVRGRAPPLLATSPRGHNAFAARPATSAPAPGGRWRW